MITKLQKLDEEKLFKIVKLNSRGKAQDWYCHFDPAPNDWLILQALFH
jgi:hypothetical protein